MKINKKTAKKAKVTLILSDKLTINVPGFIRVMDCQPIELGSIVLPYLLWIKILKIIIDTPEDEIEFAGENGLIHVGKVAILSSIIEMK